MKSFLVRFMLLPIVLLFLAMATTSYAGPPETASGLWLYIPTIETVETHGCNTFLTTTEVGVWSGTFNGASTEAGKVVIHCNGKYHFDAIVTFEEVEVNGRSGSLIMSVNGNRPDATSDWTGRFVILSGTEELTTLRGQGTWWGPGWNPATPDEYGVIHYAGNIHFEPN